MRAADAESLAALAGEIGQKLSTALRDVVPPEAHAHLVNAQRELLTALFLIYEHQADSRRPKAGARKPARAQAVKAKRVQRIPVE